MPLVSGSPNTRGGRDIFVILRGIHRMARSRRLLLGLCPAWLPSSLAGDSKFMMLELLCSNIMTDGLR